jgi:hypothetical protein
MIRGVGVVITDDLSAPLGQKKPARRRKLTLAELYLVGGLAGLGMVIGTGWMFLAESPFTRASTPAANVQTPPAPAATVDRAADIRLIRLSPGERTNMSDGMSEPPPAAGPPSRSITIIDGSSGRRQEIQIPIAADAAPDESADPRPEPSRSTPAPRASSERPRASEANARRIKTGAAKAEPR